MYVPHLRFQRLAAQNLALSVSRMRRVLQNRETQKQGVVYMILL
jgi:hypothetical protein